ncbi:MAG TPA: NAD(P)/FAD-dependent oxidoreductase [Sphingomonas sp.]|nr:NAD(P)/FAD-dependent oxidoreductase [Sphingomonas sp.]
MQIVVVGGGAGGLELVRKLGVRFGAAHDVTLVDKSHTHVWKPLLHEVATGSLDANLDEVGYRSHCYRWGYRFFFGSLDGIDRTRRQLFVAPLLDDDGSELIGRHAIHYDYLVLSTGSVGNDFGTPGVRDFCLSLDDRAQADRFRAKLLNQCLRVSRAMTEDPHCDEHVRIVIIGGGATGVELSAELYNAAGALRLYGLEDFDESRLQVTLIEAGPRILPQLPERLAEAARGELERLGVRVLTGMRVTSAEPHAILVHGGERIDADLMVWAAGVKGADMLRELDGLEVTNAARLMVRPTLQTTLDERIFAIGDCCHFIPEGAMVPIPPRAQAAHQMAQAAYRNLVALMHGRPLRPFVYHDHGSLVSLSRFSTVGSLMGNLVGGKLAIEGRLARIVYTSLYRMHLIAIHGWLRGMGLLLVGKVNQIIRPKLKVH